VKNEIAIYRQNIALNGRFLFFGAGRSVVKNEIVIYRQNIAFNGRFLFFGAGRSDAKSIKSAQIAF